MREKTTDDQRKLALKDAQGTRRAHKLKSIQWNLYSYGAVVSAGAASLLVLATSLPKWVQATPAILATIFTGILGRRPELKRACHGHQAAARDLKHEIVRFQTQGAGYSVTDFVDKIQELDQRGSVPLELLSEEERPESG